MPRSAPQGVHPAAEWGCAAEPRSMRTMLSPTTWPPVSGGGATSAALDVLDMVRSRGGSGSTLERVRAEIDTTAEEVPPIGSLNDAIGSFVVLAVLADVAAADGYFDPRLGG